MTRAEAFYEAWRLGGKEKDFSLVDQIYNPDYKAVDVFAGVEVNLDADKEVVLTLGDLIIATPPEILQEEENFLKIKTNNNDNDSFQSHNQSNEIKNTEVNQVVNEASGIDSDIEDDIPF